MAVVITGFVQSSYVWTARAALNVRKIEYEFKPLAPGDNRKPDYLGKSPYGKVPLAEIDGEPLFETSAIMRWAEATGDGPSLFPGDALAAARVEQWVSALNAYYYQPIVPDYVLQYIFAGEGGPDRAKIDAGVKALDERLATLNAKVGNPWVIGDKMSAADLLAGPMLAVLNMFPESKELLAKNENLGRLVGAMMQIPEFASVAPGG